MGKGLVQWFGHCAQMPIMKWKKYPKFMPWLEGLNAGRSNLPTEPVLVIPTRGLKADSPLPSSLYSGSYGEIVFPSLLGYHCLTFLLRIPVACCKPCFLCVPCSESSYFRGERLGEAEGLVNCKSCSWENLIVWCLQGWALSYAGSHRPGWAWINSKVYSYSGYPVVNK